MCTGRTVQLEKVDVVRVVAEAHRRAPLAVDVGGVRGRVDRDACDDCKLEALPLQEAFKSDLFKSRLAARAKELCVRLELFSPTVCNGTIDLFTDVRRRDLPAGQ